VGDVSNGDDEKPARGWLSRLPEDRLTFRDTVSTHGIELANLLSRSTLSRSVEHLGGHAGLQREKPSM